MAAGLVVAAVKHLLQCLLMPAKSPTCMSVHIHKQGYMTENVISSVTAYAGIIMAR